MKANILEIFSSIQGEGLYAGQPQLFIRFFECNMHCVWCDTPHSIGDTTRRYKEYTLDELMVEIEPSLEAVGDVSLTGGEPLLQDQFIAALVPKLKEKGVRVHLETNGIFADRLQTVIGGIDVIAMDLKLPSSTGCRPYWDEHRAFLKSAAGTPLFIKAVITSGTSDSDWETALRLVKDISPGTTVYLQPNYGEMNKGVMNRCQDLLKQSHSILPDVRILPQVHKFMKLR